jgi:putative heme iron utilization protein
MLQELERVALIDDLPGHGLKAGDIGMVVHVYAGHKGYEVEFVTVNGELVALVSVYPSQIRQLEPNEIASARRVKSA